jgi:excisionase family DNA binding protein
MVKSRKQKKQEKMRVKPPVNVVKEKMITTTMAADILGFTKDYTRSLCLRGIIKAVKLGHDWLLYESDLKGIVRQRKKKEA